MITVLNCEPHKNWVEIRFIIVAQSVNDKKFGGPKMNEQRLQNMKDSMNKCGNKIRVKYMPDPK